MNIITIDALDYKNEEQLKKVLQSTWNRGLGIETKNFTPHQHKMLRNIIRKEK